MIFHQCTIVTVWKKMEKTLFKQGGPFSTKAGIHGGPVSRYILCRNYKNIICKYKILSQSVPSLLSSTSIRQLISHNSYVQDVRKCEWTQHSSHNLGAYCKPAPH